MFFSDVIGQKHLLGEDGALRVMLESGNLSSIIFWGPPGVGKTTLAKLLADETDMEFVQISAIFSGVADLKKVFETAKLRRQTGRGTMLFVDEIHRFNKAQQDGFLPHMEDGTIVLVGATTENPSFELNAAVLSRSQVMVLKRLTLADLELVVQRAEGLVKRALPLVADAREAILEMADGDGRALINILEQCFCVERCPQSHAGGIVKAAVAACTKIRQVRGGTLQPDFCAAQIGAGVGPGCQCLLVVPDAGRR